MRVKVLHDQRIIAVRGLRACALLNAFGGHAFRGRLFTVCLDSFRLRHFRAVFHAVCRISLTTCVCFGCDDLRDFTAIIGDLCCR